MKNALILLGVVLCLVIALAACNRAESTVSIPSALPESTATATPTPTPTPVPTPTPTPTPEPTSEPEDPLEELRVLFDDREGPADEKGVTIDYHVYSPVQGEDDESAYPVMIWLHGMGQGLEPRMPLYESEVAKFASEDYQRQFSVDGEYFGAYIVVPRANEDEGEVQWGFYTTNSWMADEDQDGISDQLPALQNAIHQFLEEEAAHIDPDRVYLGGFSAGGYMTWQTLLSEPELYAAAYPICPAYAPSREQLETVAETPIWLISGKLDPLVQYEDFIAPTWEIIQETNQREETRHTAFDFILEGDGKTPTSTQHSAWVPVTNNLFYDDGTPYDPNYPEGFIPWLSAQSR